MKKKQLLSWAISLVMTLTVFSIPVSGFATVDSDLPDAEIEAAQSEDAAAPDDETAATDENAATDEAAAIDKETAAPDNENNNVTAVKRAPNAAGGTSQKATNTKYAFYIDTDDGLKKIEGGSVSLSQITECWISVLGDDPNTSKFDEIAPPKTIWTNSKPDIVGLSYNDDEENYIPAPTTNLTQTKNHEVWIVPKSAGKATLFVGVYNGSTLLQMMPLTITISQTEFEKAKYDGFLWSCWINYADYSKQTVYGHITSISEYNDEVSGMYPQISASDLDKLRIKVTVGSKTYNAVIDKTKRKFTAKFSKVKEGTKVKGTYTMGSRSLTNRDEDIVVTKWIKPTIKAKNYTYDGKWHDGAATVKYGKKTLKLWKDYAYDSYGRKDVGRCWYSVYCSDDEDGIYGNYRFKERGVYFKINPKGTSLKKLKKGKKSITVKWKKQSMKMSKKRVTGYQIQLATNKKFTKNKKVVTVKGYKKTSKKVKKLKKKKKYYVRVRTYMKVGKYTYYSKWSKAKRIKTK